MTILVKISRKKYTYTHINASSLLAALSSNLSSNYKVDLTFTKANLYLSNLFTVASAIAVLDNKSASPSAFSLSISISF